MAKLFYTLEEAAAKLGVSADQVKQMAAGGKLQQFRDRDRLMYKRDQVDGLAATGGGGGGSSESSSGPIPLAPSSGETDAIDLSADVRKGAGGRKEDPRQATGVSVFDADEVEPADPMAQTQVTQPVADGEELQLESVGSGSGLLDLTRESDDTSLGAELLDEIYPGSEGSDAKVDPSKAAAAGAGSGLATLDVGSSASGLENLQTVPLTAEQAPPGMDMTAGLEPEPFDGGGSGLGVGLMVGALAALIVAMLAAGSAVTGATNPLVRMMGESSSNLMMYSGGLLVISLALGGIGYLVGNALSK